MIKFKVGKCYSDVDGIHTGVIVKRTDKSVWVDDGRGHVYTCRIKVQNGIETIKPYGNYSTSPTLCASHEC